MKTMIFRFVPMTLLYFAAIVAQAQEPLRIGNIKQLFFDDFIIASQPNLTKVPHEPQRHPANPVLVGDQPWEKWQAYVDGRPAVYDEEKREFKLYYLATLLDPKMPAGFRFKTCYAVSRDGIRWTKPNLGQVEWDGSRANNILKWGANWMRRPNVIKDLREPDPKRRYKMTFADVIGKDDFVIAKAYSSDGVVWHNDGKPWHWAHHNHNLLGWDPRIQQYVIYVRMPGSPNTVGRSTSVDFVTWTEPQKVLAPEDGEAVHFKGNAAFLYEGVYLGWLWVYDRQLKLDMELVFSRDGIEWQRVFPGKFIFPRGPEGAWDSEGIVANAPVVHRDQLWIYYGGWNLPYGNRRIMALSEEGLMQNGVRVQNATGLATLRLDGFVSLDAGAEEGVLTTKLLNVPGGPLRVNADVRGELRVEVLDRSGQPLPGYAVGDNLPIRSDGLRHEVRWKGKKDLAQLRGQSVSLRFRLRNASLYSFWFQSKRMYATDH